MGILRSCNAHEGRRAFHSWKKSPEFSLAWILAAAVVLLAPAAARSADLYDNTNIDTVSNGPTAPTVFTLATSALVTELRTYHWNNGRGEPTGTIGLLAGNGQMYGPFPARGEPGSNGAPNVNWVATPNVTLPAGSYTVLDSDTASWSQNARSNHKGFAIVRGNPGSDGATHYEYAVKFVCGTPNLPVVAQGQYFTAVNVHNPNGQSAVFRKKIAVALPSERSGPISDFFDARLEPDAALEIDCPDILEHAHAGGFLKGFVVVESELELDVVTVYTAGHPQVETMRIERAPSRFIARTQAVTPPDLEHCPPNQRTSHDAVGNEGCCCNYPKTYPPGGRATWWPDCRQGLTCVGNLSGPGIAASTYGVCVPSASAGSTINPQIYHSQPAFCGQR